MPFPKAKGQTEKAVFIGPQQTLGPIKPPPPPPPKKVAVVAKTTVKVAVKPAVKPAVSLVAKQGYNPCSCVSYVQSFYPGVRTANGMAYTFPRNSSVPSVGAVVVMYPNHVAIVSAIEGGYLILKESNYKRCSVTYGRRLSVNSPQIRGYFR